MAQSNVLSIRMDEKLKKSFDSVCSKLGLSMTTAVTIFAKKMTREKRLPFEVSAGPFFGESNMKALESSVEQMKQGKTVTKTIEELEKTENE